MNIDEKYMRRAIQLGKNALGSAAPNPMVGCVVVHNDKIIGEGYTSPAGGAHAEVNAIASVADKSLLSQATLYVTLEPCSHFGRTAPCADMIAKHRIKKVVVGLQDPNPKVAGKGLQRLKNAGVQVKTNVLELECRQHHKRFLTFQENKRPYVILKWAASQDGFIAPDDELRGTKPEPFWLSNAKSRQLVHQWRAEEMAILVGTSTVLMDNPKLDVRTWKGKNPLRVILDAELKVPNTHHVLDNQVATLVFTNSDKEAECATINYQKIDFNGDLAKQICDHLYAREITSLIVEGGKKTLETFINENLWDEARIFKSPVFLKRGVTSPKISGKLANETSILKDTLTLLENDS